MVFWTVKIAITSSIKCSYLAHFPAQVPPTPKNPPRKKFLKFLEIELSSSNIKKILIFSQEKAFPIFSYISGSGHPQKIFIFQETEPLKSFLYFRKCSKLKEFLYLRKLNFLAWKNSRKVALKDIIKLL